MDTVLTVFLVVREVTTVPSGSGEQRHYELYWRAGRGACRGGCTTRRTAVEIDKGSDPDVITICTKLHRSKQRARWHQRNILLCLSEVYGRGRDGGTVFSNEVAFDISRMAPAVESHRPLKKRLLRLSFQLPQHRAADILVEAIGSCGDTEAADMWSLPNNAPPLDLGAARSPAPSPPPYTVSRSPSNMTASSPYRSMQRSFVARISNNLLGSMMGYSHPGLSDILEEIGPLLDAELTNEDNEVLLRCEELIEPFLKKHYDHPPGCEELVQAALFPDATLLPILRNRGLMTQEGDDLSKAVPCWLHKVATEIADAHTIPIASRGFQVLKTILHRYFYSHTVANLRRFPFACGPWGEVLRAARIKDDALRTKILELRDARGKDPREWGIMTPFADTFVFTPVVRELGNLRGCHVAPYDAALRIAKASSLLTRIIRETRAEGIVGADSFFPVFAWCVAEAMVFDAFETICFMESFMSHRAEESVIVGSEFDYYCTCFEAAVCYVVEGAKDRVPRLPGDDEEEEDGDDGCGEEETWSNDSDHQPALETPSHAWADWVRRRRVQQVRDRAAAAWAGGRNTAMLWRDERLKGHRRGWYWRQGMADASPLQPATYACLAGRNGEYSGIAERLDVTKSSLQQLEVDIQRTLAGFRAVDRTGLPQAVRSLLQAYVQLRPDVGYVQGMGYLATMLILHHDDPADAFVVFAAVVHSPVLRCFYSFNTDRMELHFRVFDRLLHHHNPSVAKGLEVLPHVFLLDWWMTLWTRQFDYETVAAPLWSLFLGGGGAPHLLHAISIGIVCALPLGKDPEATLVYLSSLRSQSVDAIAILDSVAAAVHRITEAKYLEAVRDEEAVPTDDGDDPGLVCISGCGEIDEAALRAATWFSTHSDPAEAQEVPSLREWVWDYPKRRSSSRWDALLKYAEMKGTVTVAGVDFVDWTGAVLTNWAETDREFALLHEARQGKGLCFVEQLQRNSSLSVPGAESALRRAIAGRGTLRRSRGWTPHSFLALAAGPIQINSPVPYSLPPFRLETPYSMAGPLPSLSPPSTCLPPRSPQSEVIVEIAVWCKAFSGTRVSQLVITSPDGSTTSPRTRPYTPGEGVAAQLSPTERFRVSLPSIDHVLVHVVVRAVPGDTEVARTKEVRFTASKRWSGWVAMLTPDGADAGQVQISGELVRHTPHPRCLPNDAVPLIIPFLPLRQLLGCRRVGRVWNQVVTDVLNTPNGYPAPRHVSRSLMCALLPLLRSSDGAAGTALRSYALFSPSPGDIASSLYCAPPDILLSCGAAQIVLRAGRGAREVLRGLLVAAWELKSEKPLRLLSHAVRRSHLPQLASPLQTVLRPSCVTRSLWQAVLQRPRENAALVKGMLETGLPASTHPPPFTALPTGLHVPPEVVGIGLGEGGDPRHLLATLLEAPHPSHANLLVGVLLFLAPLPDGLAAIRDAVACCLSAAREGKLEIAGVVLSGAQRGVKQLAKGMGRSDFRELVALAKELCSTSLPDARSLLTSLAHAHADEFCDAILCSQ